MTDQVALRCRGIRVSFGRSQVIDGIDLDVVRGSIHALIGPNGAGKTTLANVITGHVRRYQGTVEFDGRRVHGPPWRRARAGIGRKFQIPRVFTELSAQTNLVVADNAVGRHRQADRTPDLAAAPAEHLAHGQRQHLELDMVHLRQPKLVVLDEPTAGLTRTERIHLGDTIREHQTRCAASYLIVEHDLDFVASLADAVSYLENGRLHLTGDYQSIRSDPRVRTTYLGKHA